MAIEKIAILTDSGTDVPPELIEKYDIFVLPLTVVFSDGTFSDRVDITTDEIIERLNHEIPSTSLPSPAVVAKQIEEIIDLGYTHIVAVTISSGLSGTYGMIDLMLQGYSQIESLLIDSKNIGTGAGMAAVAAAKAVAEGIPFKEIEAYVFEAMEKCRLFFTLDTLDYLKAGGRIGSVAYRMGALLDLCPVIECNAEGKYHTIQMGRGHKQAVKRSINTCKKMAAKYSVFDAVFVYGEYTDKAKKICQQMKDALPNVRNFYEVQVSPALLVHTGPGLSGFCVQGIY